MKLSKVFSQGRILNGSAYAQIKELDVIIFPGCSFEFHKNRDWWAVIDRNGEVVAYCGSIYSEGICIFNRAWVKSKYRGKGIQKKMIKARLNAAVNYCNVAITYTTFDNYPSANNLIHHGFKLYCPSYMYAGKGMLYFKKDL